MTYIPNHLQPHELVDQTIHQELGGDARRVARLFDNRVLITADRLRDRYGAIHCNNWFWGGPFSQRGFRDPFSPTGARRSDHKAGRALDVHFGRVSAEQVRMDILADPWHEDFLFITSLEMSIGGKPISWLHFSTRNHDKLRFGIEQLHL